MKSENTAKLKMITIEKLLEMQVNNENMMLVDALPEETYKKGHLPDAVNLPSEKIDESAGDKLDKDATIVTYCAHYGCHASTEAARKLIDLGYPHVVDYKAGTQGWQAAGFELVS